MMMRYQLLERMLIISLLPAVLTAYTVTSPPTTEEPTTSPYFAPVDPYFAPVGSVVTTSAVTTPSSSEAPSTEKTTVTVENSSAKMLKDRCFCEVCSEGCTTTIDKKEKRLESHGGSLFYVHMKDERPYTMQEAETACNTWFNGHLTSIHSQEEYKNITKMIADVPEKFADKGRKTWVGGLKFASNQWKWIDGTKMNENLFNSFWYPGEPNNIGGRENALDLWNYNGTTGLHDVTESTKRYSFVCRIDCPITETPTTTVTTETSTTPVTTETSTTPITTETSTTPVTTETPTTTVTTETSTTPITTETSTTTVTTETSTTPITTETSTTPITTETSTTPVTTGTSTTPVTTGTSTTPVTTGTSTTPVTTGTSTTPVATGTPTTPVTTETSKTPVATETVTESTAQKEKCICEYCSEGCTAKIGNKEKRIVSHDGSLYHFNPSGSYTWDEAESACKSWFNGHLASVHSQEEFDFLSEQLKPIQAASTSGIQVWFGGFGDAGKWKWNDGTEMNNAVINKLWSKGEPNNSWGNEDRMECHDKGLNDVPGYHSLGLFVCKVNCSESSTTPLPPTTTIVTTPKTVPSVIPSETTPKTTTLILPRKIR